jgi:transposase
MSKANPTPKSQSVCGGVDTHKDLHVAAVVNSHDRILGSEVFPTTLQGYRLMLAWMQSFGPLERIGVEATGTYGAGLLRYMQKSGVQVLEVTAPDRHDRRKRGKDDHLDAEAAAHAAFAGIRTVTPKTRDGMIEALRVLKACRKTAVTLHDTGWLRALKGGFLEDSFPPKERPLDPQSNHRPHLDAIAACTSEQDAA